MNQIGHSHENIWWFVLNFILYFLHFLITCYLHFSYHSCKFYLASINERKLGFYVFFAVKASTGLQVRMRHLGLIVGVLAAVCVLFVLLCVGVALLYRRRQFKYPPPQSLSANHMIDVYQNHPMNGEYLWPIWSWVLDFEGGDSRSKELKAWGGYDLWII